jgi:hypothetical protein
VARKRIFLLRLSEEAATFCHLVLVAIDGIGVPFQLRPLGNPAFAPGFLFAYQFSYDSMICHGKRHGA